MNLLIEPLKLANACSNLAIKTCKWQKYIILDIFSTLFKCLFVVVDFVHLVVWWAIKRPKNWLLLDYWGRPNWIMWWLQKQSLIWRKLEKYSTSETFQWRKYSKWRDETYPHNKFKLIHKNENCPRSKHTFEKRILRLYFLTGKRFYLVKDVLVFSVHLLLLIVIGCKLIMFAISVFWFWHICYIWSFIQNLVKHLRCFFAKSDSGWMPLIIFAKSHILDFY